MKEIKIEELAYRLKKAKEDNQPQPIFFLGAGASKTAGIPLASDIVKDILNKHSENPSVQGLSEDSKTYSCLMGCLLPYERDTLLKNYIDEAKINVTHIYLAQLLKEGYADYILTVNFDNLILRALSLFNIFPSTYDMAILKDLTTSTFKEKSVVYLHGQSHGLWLLNTDEEMKKVNETVPKIFDSIKNKRPWVFIGYSGDDPIFQHIKNLGRFDNGLYWIGHEDRAPNEGVSKFLADPHKNGSLIKGYDSDSFMLKLNSELGLEQPFIVDKPFSALKEMLTNIVDIEDKEHFKVVKQRLDISLRQLNTAIEKFEKGNTENITETIKEETEIDLLSKEIINLIIKREFDVTKIKEIEEKSEKYNDKKLKELVASLYVEWGDSLSNLAELKEGKESEKLFEESFEKYKKASELNLEDFIIFNNWGTSLSDLAKLKEGEESENLFKKSFEKYKTASELNLEYSDVFYNWGSSLSSLAKLKEGKESENLFKESFGKYQKASELNPNNSSIFNNWGISLSALAKLKEGKASENLFEKSFEKYKKASELNSGDSKIFNNWGNSLSNLAELKEGKESENLFEESFEKYKKASELNSGDFEIFNNWGISLSDLAELKEGKESENLFEESFEKYKKASELNPNNSSIFNNWANSLMNLAKLKERKESENLLNQAKEKLLKVISLGGEYYNLACLYAIKSNKEEALYYLDISLKSKEIEISFVLKDEDWKDYLEDEDFKNLIKKYK